MRGIVSSCCVYFFLAAIILSVPALAVDQTEGANEAIWKQAEQAYRLGQKESGHSYLKQLVDQNPGNEDLAVKCLERMIYEADRDSDVPDTETFDHKAPISKSQLSGNPWAQYAAQRLCSLARFSPIAASSKTLHKAFEVHVEHLVWRGRRLEAIELVDQFAKKYPRDPYWLIRQATVHRRVDSSTTRSLYASLRAKIDLNHPDPTAREHWTEFADTLASEPEELPLEILPVPKGSPLSLMNPDDPGGEWGVALNRAVSQIPQVIDRLALTTTVGENVVLWKDMSGLTDPVRALDLHLLGQPEADLKPLRKLQAERFALEDHPPAPTEAETLALSRRYAWALPAQRRLLVLGNRMLWAGHAQSALRCFKDLLNHATNARLRDTAQVGYWTALAQIEHPSRRDELLGNVAPGRRYIWLGKPTTAGEICERLIKKRKVSTPLVALALKDLVQHVVRLAPGSPLTGTLPSNMGLVARGRELFVSGGNMLAMYSAEKPSRPLWSKSPRPQSTSKLMVDRAGLSFPEFDGPILYTRWGYEFVPAGIAALDRSTGRLIWTNAHPYVDRARGSTRKVPLGDPVLSDGRLYYLQWNAQGNVNHGQGRRLSLICFDARRRTQIWDRTIATAGLDADINDSLNEASAASTLFGNRVTVHRGAIYSSSNCGMVVRSDVRGGRTDWIHYYRVTRRRSNLRNLGTEPIIAGDHVVFLPKDSNKIFALDQRTGRRVWENSSLQSVQLAGRVDDLLIVCGPTTIAGLDIATGVARWYRPLGEPVLGRTQVIGSSVFVAQGEQLRRFDARTGDSQGTRSWGVQNEQPLNFAIQDRNLYLVTDRPAEDLRREVGRRLNQNRPKDASPFAMAWSLPRKDPKIAVPPPHSALHGNAYVVSEGILECIEISGRGRIRWQRFLDTRDPRIHFAGKTMLIRDHAAVGGSGRGHRVAAYDGTNGRLLWSQVTTNRIDGLPNTLRCGNMQVFHDGTSRLWAIDLSNGQQAWERNLGVGHRLKISWDEKHLHVFFVSKYYLSGHTRGCDVTHIRMDAENGRPSSRHRVTYQPPSGVSFAKRRVRIGELGIHGGQVYMKSHIIWNRNWKNATHVFHYSMDKKPAEVVRVFPADEAFVFWKVPYYITASHTNKVPVHIVRRYDDKAYRFDLGRRINPHSTDIIGDRLVTARGPVLIADLTNRRFIVAPGVKKQKYDQNGIVMRDAASYLLKIVNQGGEGQAVYRFDLQTGRRTSFVIENQTAPFVDQNVHGGHQAIPQFDGAILLSDGSTVTAWDTSSGSQK